MDKVQKSAYARKKTKLVRKVTDLQKLVHQEQQRRDALHLREQVLADICILIDSLQHIKKTRDTGHGANTAQHEAPVLISDGMVDEQLAQCVLAAIPSYCCIADLLENVIPELLQQALSLRPAEIGWMLRHTFCEILTLMELTARSQSPSGTNSDGSGSISDSNSQGAGPSQTWQELHAVVDRFCGVAVIVFAVQPMVVMQTAAINQRTQEMGDPPAQLFKDASRRLKLTAKQAGYLGTAVQEVELIRHSSWVQLGPLLQEASCPSLILQAAQQQQQHPHDQQQQRPRDVWDHAVGAGQGRGGIRAAAAMAEGPQGGATPSTPYHQLCQQLGHMSTYGALLCALTADALTPLQKAHWIVASYPWLPAPVVLCRVAASIFEQANREQHDKHHHQEQQQQQELEQQQTDQAQEASAGEAVQQQGQASGGAQDPGGSLSAVVSNGGAGDVAACQRHLEQRRQRWWQQMQLREQGAQEAQQQQQEPGEQQQRLLADGLASLPEDVLQSLDTDGSLAGCLSGVGLGGGHC